MLYRLREKTTYHNGIPVITFWYAQYTRDERGWYWKNYHLQDGYPAKFDTQDKARAYLTKRLGGREQAIAKAGGLWVDTEGGRVCEPYYEVMTEEKYNNLPPEYRWANK